MQGKIKKNKSQKRPFLVAIGKNIQKQREEKTGHTQASLGFAIGMHPNYLSDIERGVGNISVIGLAKIAHVLGIGVEEFFEGVDLKLAFDESKLDN